MAEHKYHVFISYNSKDRDIVLPIADALEQAGLKPWMDRHLLFAGALVEQEIDEGMSQSACCAVLIGPNGEGPWSRQERQVATARSAHDSSFRVFGVVLPGAAGFAALPSFLQIRQAIDLRSGLSPQPLNILIDAIHGRIRGEESPSEAHDGSHHELHARSHATVAHLHDNLDAIRESIRELKLTPVIGSGCSLIGRSYGAAWNSIGERIAAVLSFLGPDDPGAHYLRSLAALPPYRVRLGAIVPAEDQREPDDLQALQLALAALGAALGQLFAGTMMESKTPIWDTTSFKLEIDTRDERLRRIHGLLFQACLAAYRVRENHVLNPARTGLGAAGLYARLLELSTMLATDAVRVSFVNHPTVAVRTAQGESVLHDLAVFRRRSYVADEDGTPDRLDLALNQLEWVADALWHTFRYNSAAYPRTDEFAFQVSLLATDARSRRPDLVSAAELGRVMLRPEVVAAWFRHFSGESPPPMRRFYNALAQILVAQFRAFKQRASRLLPVAFSSNHDLEMESALHRAPSIDEFYVVVPVNVYRRDDPQAGYRWLLGRTRKSDPLERPRWSLLGKDPKFNPANTDGPMVIKLHGSPLHHLPAADEIRQDDDAAPEYERIEHSIMLSEFEFLRNIVWRDPVPDLFHRILLEERRSLFFLGHSLREWSTRLRLFNHVYPQMSKPAVRGPLGMIAINRSYDPYRTAMLGSIGIHRWIGDLEEVAAAVETVLG